MENTKYPLITVFYIDKTYLTNSFLTSYSTMVNDIIMEKDANVLAFFVPTDGESRIECINPIMVKEADMERINKIVEDLAKNFDIGQGADKGKNDDDAHRLIARDDE